MLLDILLVAAGLALLLKGGDLLVVGAVGVAERLGVSPLFVGVVLVGMGTSAPELFASIEAVRQGAPGMAWGNIVGSNVANTLLILGAAALMAPFPVERGPLWRDGGVGLLASLLLLWFARAGVSLWEGGVLLAALGGYFLYVFRTERTTPATTGLGDKAAAFEQWHPDLHASGRSAFLRAAVKTLFGIAIVIGGGYLLVDGARGLAQAMGASDTLIGLTVVAIGTSLPELATTVIAARKGEGGIAFGNVLGSNIYNILAIGGTTGVLAPGSLPAELRLAELSLLAVTAFVLMIFARTGHRFVRWEGAALMAGYAAYLVYAISRAA